MTAISDKHADLLQSGTLDLGPPVAAEENFTEGGSRQFFALGAIYFHPRVGAAFEAHGLILQTYVAMGEHLGGLGYPLSDEMDDPNVAGGRMNVFELGTLNFDPAVGVTTSFTDQPILPQVVVKLVDGIALGLDRGGVLDLDGVGRRRRALSR
jgi:hypothetical protein